MNIHDQMENGKWIHPENASRGKMGNSCQAGYTFVELAVILGVLIVLFSIVTINLLGAKQSTSLSTTMDALASDIRSQQLKAVVGDTEGRGATSNYGVYFGTTSYTLFHGNAYSPADTSNFVVNLGDQIQFSNVMFPASTIIFTKGTGEISGFGAASSSATIKNTSSVTQKTIILNTLGVITAVN